MVPPVAADGVPCSWARLNAGTRYFEDMLSSDTEMDLMQALGLNVVRLGFMWTGVNPQPNVFNQTCVDPARMVPRWFQPPCQLRICSGCRYIEIIRTIVHKLASRGVYTLLDMHEDVLSSDFCLYGFVRFLHKWADR